MLWGELDRRTQQYGLATTGGRVSTTGVAGFTLGGGSGWIERKHGLACDNLTGIELVSADGEKVLAGEDENPDLLWAHRGGGGNFGVVTSLELRLHELGPMVFGGLAIYDPVHGPTIARALRNFHDPGPAESGLALAYLTAPPEPFVPEQWHGKLVCGFAGLWAGPPDEGARELREVLAAAPPIVNLFGEIPYAEMQSMIDDPPGKRNWWTAEYLTGFPDDAIDRFCAYSERMPNSFTPVARRRLGPRGRGQRGRDAAAARRRLGRAPVLRLGGRRARRGAHRLGPRGTRGARGLQDRRHVPELRRRRGRRPGARELRRELRSARRDQGLVGPRQRLPRQPEHRPGEGGRLAPKLSYSQAAVATFARPRLHGPELLRPHAEGTAGEVGDAFLRGLVRNVAGALAAKLVLVAEAADPSGVYVRVVAGFYAALLYVCSLRAMTSRYS